MVQVKFKTFGSNSAFGGFAPGDTLRTSDAMAKHLVDEGLAVYMKAPAPPAAPAPAEPPAPAPVAPAKPATKKAKAQK